MHICIFPRLYSLNCLLGVAQNARQKCSCCWFSFCGIVVRHVVVQFMTLVALDFCAGVESPTTSRPFLTTTRKSNWAASNTFWFLGRSLGLFAIRFDFVLISIEHWTFSTIRHSRGPRVTVMFGVFTISFSVRHPEIGLSSRLHSICFWAWQVVRSIWYVYTLREIDMSNKTDVGRNVSSIIVRKSTLLNSHCRRCFIAQLGKLFLWIVCLNLSTSYRDRPPDPLTWFACIFIGHWFVGFPQ